MCFFFIRQTNVSPLGSDFGILLEDEQLFGMTEMLLVLPASRFLRSFVDRLEYLQLLASDGGTGKKTKVEVCSKVLLKSLSLSDKITSGLLRMFSIDVLHTFNTILLFYIR